MPFRILLKGAVTFVHFIDSFFSILTQLWCQDVASSYVEYKQLIISLFHQGVIYVSCSFTSDTRRHSCMKGLWENGFDTFRSSKYCVLK